MLNDKIQKPFKVEECQQESLLDIGKEHEIYWQDMPEFTTKDTSPSKRITLNFLTVKDAVEFGKKIGQNITEKTDSLWFPKRERLEAGRYFYSGPKTSTKYPICIPSKGRADCQTTGKKLDELGCSYRFFVEDQEYDWYVQIHGTGKVVKMPFSNLGQGSIPARNYIMQWAKDNGHHRHWIMDDNIEMFYRLNCNSKVIVKGGGILRSFEDFIDRFENVKMAGLHHDGFIKDSTTKKPYILNSRVYSCILLETNCGFDWRGRYNEDTDLSLRILKSGGCTLLCCSLLMSKGATVGNKSMTPMKGGNTDNVYNTGDHRLAFAESLRDQHPDCVKVVWKFNRWHHEVDYSMFKKNKLKLKPGLVLRQGVNNYGMELTEWC